MKNHIIKFSVIVSVILLSACKIEKSNTKDKESSKIENPYLGQKTPSLTPEAFAPGMVTTNGWEYGGVFTPDMKEFYYLKEVFDDEGNRSQDFVVYSY